MRLGISRRGHELIRVIAAPSLGYNTLTRTKEQAVEENARGLETVGG